MPNWPDSNTFFIHNNSNIRLNSSNDIIFNIAAGQTFVDFEHDAYLKDTTITTSEYKLGLASETKDYNIKNFIGIIYGVKPEYVNADGSLTSQAESDISIFFDSSCETGCKRSINKRPFSIEAPSTLIPSAKTKFL